jgi:SNF2 family DNA or RNA helicase
MGAIPWAPGPSHPGTPAPAVRAPDPRPAPVRGRTIAWRATVEVAFHALPAVEAAPPCTVALWPPRPRADLEPAARVAPPDDRLGRSVATGPDLRSRLLAVLRPPPASWAGGLDWPSDPYPFQLQGVRQLVEREALLLADEMGLGKTVQALVALRLLALRGDVERCLVVVPAAVFGQWRDQIARWAPELRLVPVRGQPELRRHAWRAAAHVHLVTYETLRSDPAPAWERIWDLLIVDEAQRIKNADTDTAVCVKRLWRRRAWALTGTPLENRLEELASVLEVVRPRLPDQEPAPLPAPHRLRGLLAELQLRRRKTEVLRELPPRTVTELLLPLDGPQRRAYERAEREGVVRLRQLGPALRISNVLELILRLKQICNFDPESGASAKADDLERRLEQLEGTEEKALVFSQFTDDTFGVGAIVRRLTRFRPLALTGAMDQAQREAVVRRFRRDPERRLLVVSLRAGGVGLDLQAASYVFHFDRWWNPAVEDQADGRSHRIGQTRPVHVYAYTVQDSIEQRIMEILRAKRLLFEEVVEGVGIDVGQALTRAELLQVVGLGTGGAADG